MCNTEDINKEIEAQDRRIAKAREMVSLFHLAVAKDSLHNARRGELTDDILAVMDKVRNGRNWPIGIIAAAADELGHYSLIDFLSTRFGADKMVPTDMCAWGRFEEAYSSLDRYKANKIRRWR